jgi:hypothetical protein
MLLGERLVAAQPGGQAVHDDLTQGMMIVFAAKTE